MGHMAEAGLLMDMPEEFYDWLDQCPVRWFLVSTELDFVSYSFDVPEDDDDE